MRKTMIAVTFSTLSLLTVPAFSGPGHDHSHSHQAITAQAVEQKASKQVAELIAKGKLDKSWNAIKPAKSYQKTFEKGKEWVVELTNGAASDKTKQTLYLFYTLDGHYVAANFTGK